MSELIISVSGLRGIVGSGLTPSVAMRYAGALAQELPRGALVITRDGRGSGRMLSDVIRGSLCAAGRDVIDADVAATPTTGILVRHLDAAGGLQISASHNPASYNGIKLFGPEGRVLPAAAGEKVMQRYQSGQMAWAAHDRIGAWRACRDSTSQHAKQVLETVNVERIRSRQFRVLLDSNHGAGSRLGRELLEQLGCQAVLMGAEPNGQFAHGAEPTEENLAQVCRDVVAAQVDVGFCQDPDADRLAVIDQTGRYLGEEYTLALCLDHVLRDRKGPVVTNCSTSRMAQDLARKYGVPFYRSKVGEAHVADMMLAHDAVFGGEGNGGPIDPRVGLVRDSFVGMAQVLDAMAARRMSVGELADQLPRYAICKTKVPIDREKVAAALARLPRHWPEAVPDQMDGLRLDWPDKWLLVRASNTEPVVRIVAEAHSPGAARQLCQEAGQVLAGA